MADRQEIENKIKNDKSLSKAQKVQLAWDNRHTVNPFFAQYFYKNAPGAAKDHGRLLDRNHARGYAGFQEAKMKFFIQGGNENEWQRLRSEDLRNQRNSRRASQSIKSSSTRFGGYSSAEEQQRELQKAIAKSKQQNPEQFVGTNIDGSKSSSTRFGGYSSAEEQQRELQKAVAKSKQQNPEQFVDTNISASKKFSTGNIIKKSDGSIIDPKSKEGQVIESIYKRQRLTRKINAEQKKLFDAVTNAKTAKDAITIQEAARAQNPNVGTYSEIVDTETGKVKEVRGRLGIGDGQTRELLYDQYDRETGTFPEIRHSQVTNETGDVIVSNMRQSPNSEWRFRQMQSKRNVTVANMGIFGSNMIPAVYASGVMGQNQDKHDTSIKEHEAYDLSAFADNTQYITEDKKAFNWFADVPQGTDPLSRIGAGVVKGSSNTLAGIFNLGAMIEGGYRSVTRGKPLPSDAYVAYYSTPVTNVETGFFTGISDTVTKGDPNALSQNMKTGLSEAYYNYQKDPWGAGASTVIEGVPYVAGSIYKGFTGFVKGVSAAGSKAGAAGSKAGAAGSKAGAAGSKADRAARADNFGKNPNKPITEMTKKQMAKWLVQNQPRENFYNPRYTEMVEIWKKGKGGDAFKVPKGIGKVKPSVAKPKVAKSRVIKPKDVTVFRPRQIIKTSKKVTKSSSVIKLPNAVKVRPDTKLSNVKSNTKFSTPKLPRDLIVPKKHEISKVPDGAKPSKVPDGSGGFRWPAMFGWPMMNFGGGGSSRGGAGKPAGRKVYRAWNIDTENIGFLRGPDYITGSSEYVYSKLNALQKATRKGKWNDKVFDLDLNLNFE